MNRKEKKRLAKEALIQEKGIICLENVTASYSNAKDVHALDNISINIYPGEFVFIVGKTGSGKSTFLKLLLRELEAKEGDVFVCGENLSKLKHRQVAKFRRGLGVVFQDFRLLENRNVFENVAFAQRVIQTPSREIRRNVPAILTMVGLAKKYKAKTRDLSGGEQQRVALARALVNQPSVLLADEPTGNLDPATSKDIMDLFEEINAGGTTVVVVTHDKEMVNAMRKRVIAFRKGHVISDEEEGGYMADED